MRHLLLAALGAAGSLLMDLHALAQISTGTSTFSGQVAATCEFNLPQNVYLQYLPNLGSLASWQTFEITTNLSQVRLSIDRLTVNDEPPPVASSIEASVYVETMYEGNQYLAKATKTAADTQVFPTVKGTPNEFSLSSTVLARQMQLPRGNYSYTTTISCLQ